MTSSAASTVALLLPGMTLNSSIFPDIGVPTVAADFARQVFSPDGSLPLGHEGMDRYAALLEDQLASSAVWRARRRIVLGHSFGGMLAMWWLIARGGETSRADGLVLISTTAGPMFDAARVRLLSVGGRELRAGLTGFMRVWNRPGVTRAMKRWTALRGRDERGVDFQALSRKTDWAVDRAGWWNTDWRAMRSFRLAMSGFDVRSRLGELRIPTVVLHGTEDTLFTSSVGRSLADALPRAELRLVRGAGHALPLTHGDEVVRAVRDLLREVGD